MSCRTTQTHRLRDEDDLPALDRTQPEPAGLPATPAALANVHPSVGRDLILRMQAGHGNAYVARMAALAPAPEVGLARYKDDTAGESVGATDGMAVALPDERGRNKKKLGDKGYTERAVDILPELAGATFASDMTQKQLLAPVKPEFAELNKSVRWFDIQAQKAEDRSDTSFGGIADRAKADKAMYEAAGLKLTKAGATEERLCKEFNAGVPRANRLFVSLAKLDGMMAVMGISDPKAMVTAVTGSLMEAAPVMKALKESGKAAEKKTVPQADDSATQAAAELTTAQQEMSDKWVGVQALLEGDRAAAVKKEGEADEKKLEEIQKDIEMMKKAGTAIDASLAVMGVGLTGKTEAGGIRGALGSGAGVDDAGEWGKTSIAGLKEAGKGIGDAMGLSIPTSVSGVLETAAKLYHYQELARIKFHLGVLAKHAAHHSQVSGELQTLQTVREFDTAVKKFESAQMAMLHALSARQQAYTTFGQQLDETAAKSVPGESPGRGKERFTSVMTLTALAREVLVMADGAEQGLGSDPSAKASHKLQAEFNQLWDVNGWESHYKNESRALGDALKQLRQFEGSVEVYRMHLGQIDAAAAELLGPMVPGGAANAVY
jgi:hypothetical protein